MPWPWLSWNDILGAVLVYAYTVVIFIAVEKAWKGDRAIGRKILHIAIGNVVFILWLFDHWWVEVAIAGSALLFTLLIMPRTRRFLSDMMAQVGGAIGKAGRALAGALSSISVSEAGNEPGLAYYCLVFALLAFLFFKTPAVVAAGMLPLAYGDGLGAVIGLKYGRHPYRIIDKKSIEGSLAVFAGTALALFAGMAFYGIPPYDALWRSAAIGLAAMAAEGIAPRGLDNLAIPAVAVALFLLTGGPP